MNTDKINQAKDAVAKKHGCEDYYSWKCKTGLHNFTEELMDEVILLYHQSAIEEAGRELIRELKETDETLGAKLRNALSPHYGLPSTISKLREHPELLKIVEDMSDQAIKNNLRIDTILNAIDEQLSTLATSRDEWKRLSEEKIVELNELKEEVKGLRTTKQSAGLEAVLNWIKEEGKRPKNVSDYATAYERLVAFIQSLPHQSTKRFSLEELEFHCIEFGMKLINKGWSCRDIKDYTKSLTTEHTEVKQTPNL